jgi:hypothetical protein
MRGAAARADDMPNRAAQRPGPARSGMAIARVGAAETDGDRRRGSGGVGAGDLGSLRGGEHAAVDGGPSGGGGAVGVVLLDGGVLDALQVGDVGLLLSLHRGGEATEIQGYSRSKGATRRVAADFRLGS